MKAFIINRGKKYMGRLLAHDPVDALRKARGTWGAGLYKISPVILQQAVVAATAPGLDLAVGEEVTLEHVIDEEHGVRTRMLPKKKRKS